MKVIDAFLFAWELPILELRLHELADLVDFFVIVESRETHGSARTKPAVLMENWELVRPFQHKIRYRCLDHLEPPFGDPNGWARENFHRNALLEPILDVADPNDILMMSDCDEIPRASSVKQYLPQLQTGLHGTKQDFFYYNVNTYLGEWHGTVMGNIEAFRKNGSLQDARNKRDGLPLIPNCGWHLSWTGGLNKVLSKVNNFVHAQEDSSKLIARSAVEDVARDLLSGRDIYHRDGVVRLEHRTSNDSRLPLYFLRNQHLFPELTEEGLCELIQRELHAIQNM